MRHMPACTVDTYMHWAKDKAACRLQMRKRKGWGDGNGQPAVWFSWRARPNRLVRQTWTVQKQKARPKKREKREEKERPSLPTKKMRFPPPRSTRLRLICLFPSFPLLISQICHDTACYHGYQTRMWQGSLAELSLAGYLFWVGRRMVKRE